MAGFSAEHRDLVIERMEHEAYAAQQKFGVWSARGSEPSDFEKLSILGQEFGEVCEAVYQQLGGGMDNINKPIRAPHKGDLKLELAQVAGVCLNWLEALEEW